MAPQPRLVGPRLSLLPADAALAGAVVSGHLVHEELARLGLQAAAGWPHQDTADALRPLTEAGPPACWLVSVAGQVVGDCGWRPASSGELELGYGLALPARGQGLGTEAVGVLAAWAEQQPGIKALTAQVLVGNQPSLRLLARLGFVTADQSGDYLRLVRPVLATA